MVADLGHDAPDILRNHDDRKEQRKLGGGHGNKGHRGHRGAEDIS